MTGDIRLHWSSKNLPLVLQADELGSSARCSTAPQRDQRYVTSSRFCYGRSSLRYQAIARNPRQTVSHTDSVVENDVGQRLMNLDAAVVLNKAEFAKAIHEEADAGPSGADHLCQGFLRDLRNQSFWFTRLAKFRQQ